MDQDTSQLIRQLQTPDTFGAMLKRYRLKNEMTLQQLSEKTGVHQTTLGRLEAGGRFHELTVARITNRLPDFKTQLEKQVA